MFCACEILYDNALYKFTLHYITMTGNTAITQCTRCRLHSLTQSLAQSPPTRHDYSPPPSPPILVIVAATHNVLPTIEAHSNWPVYADVFEHPPPRLASRRPVWSDMTSGFCAQPHYCYRPYYPTARFPSPPSYMVSGEPFPDRSRPMSC